MTPRFQAVTLLSGEIQSNMCNSVFSCAVVFVLSVLLIIRNKLVIRHVRGVGGAILTDWPCVVGSPTFADIL